MAIAKPEIIKSAAVVWAGFLLTVPAAAQISMPKPPEPVTVDITQEEREALYDRQARAEKAESMTNAKGERLICRTPQDDTGSRLGRKKLCLTAAQWRARQ